jgi:hypothetical protein
MSSDKGAHGTDSVANYGLVRLLDGNSDNYCTIASGDIVHSDNRTVVRGAVHPLAARHSPHSLTHSPTRSRSLTHSRTHSLTSATRNNTRNTLNTQLTTCATGDPTERRWRGGRRGRRWRRCCRAGAGLGRGRVRAREGVGRARVDRPHATGRRGRGCRRPPLQGSATYQALECTTSSSAARVDTQDTHVPYLPAATRASGPCALACAGSAAAGGSRACALALACR